MSHVPRPGTWGVWRAPLSEPDKGCWLSYCGVRQEYRYEEAVGEASFLNAGNLRGCVYTAKRFTLKELKKSTQKEVNKSL